VFSAPALEGLCCPACYPNPAGTGYAKSSHLALEGDQCACCAGPETAPMGVARFGAGDRCAGQ
jgi:hypothetical protein